MRLNLVPPSELMDQHLIAEWNEIFMFVSALQRTLRSKNGLIMSKIPKNFTLNRGHGYFFYDKGKFVADRFELVREEMLLRGFNADPNRVFPRHLWPDRLFNDWEPSDCDIAISRDRIKEKVAMKPDWYRKTKHVKGN
jgi:deoxyribonuclease (pyrimidine dimer)